MAKKFEILRFELEVDGKTFGDFETLDAAKTASKRVRSAPGLESPHVSIYSIRRVHESTVM